MYVCCCCVTLVSKVLQSIQNRFQCGSVVFTNIPDQTFFHKFRQILKKSFLSLRHSKFEHSSYLVHTKNFKKTKVVQSNQNRFQWGSMVFVNTHGQVFFEIFRQFLKSTFLSLSHTHRTRCFPSPWRTSYTMAA